MKSFSLAAGLGIVAGQIPIVPIITSRIVPLVSPLLPIATPLPAAPVTLIAKCPVGSPLKNAAGVEYFCGMGANHQDCPAGSQCIVGPNQVYAACCQTTAATASLAPLPVSPSTSLVTPSGTPVSTVQSSSGSASVQVPQGSGQLAFTTGPAGTAFIASGQGVSQTSVSSNSFNANGNNNNNSSSEENNSTSSSEGSGESSSAEVRFLTIQNLPSGEAIALWAPPNGTQCQTQYTAELSSDGQTWSKLNLEQPFASWAMFPVSQPQFEVRVTPEHGMPMIANGQLGGKGKAQQQMNNQQMNMNQQQDVDFIFVQNLSPTEGLAMWADSNATACETQYTAEISYDGNQWRKLSMDHATDNFVMMSVTAGSPFQIRVTPENGAPMIGMSKPKGGKAGKATKH